MWVDEDYSITSSEAMKVEVILLSGWVANVEVKVQVEGFGVPMPQFCNEVIRFLFGILDATRVYLADNPSDDGTRRVCCCESGDKEGLCC